MRTREELKEESLGNFKTAGPNYPHGMAILEVLLDCRALLQKLVEKGNKTKIVTTEVPFTPRETELLNGIHHDNEMEAIP